MHRAICRFISAVTGNLRSSSINIVVTALTFSCKTKNIASYSIQISESNTSQSMWICVHVYVLVCVCKSVDVCGVGKSVCMSVCVRV